MSTQKVTTATIVFLIVFSSILVFVHASETIELGGGRSATRTMNLANGDSVTGTIARAPGVIWTANYMLLEFRRSTGGGGLTGLAALIVGIAFLLLFLLFCFLPPAALLIWGPVETKVLLIAYFVLSYGLLFLWAKGRFGRARRHALALKPDS